MKSLFVFCIALLAIGCSNNSTSYTVHEQVITPKTLTYLPGETVKTLSITHTCTCPFTWNANPLDLSQVLQPAHGTWDSTRASINIDRSKLTVDTLHTALEVKSSYGTDTVQITVIK